MTSTTTDYCPTCGGPVHPCYRPGQCEDCRAATAQRFHLPGSLSFAGRLPAPETKDDFSDYKRAVYTTTKDE